MFIVPRFSHGASRVNDLRQLSNGNLVEIAAATSPIGGHVDRHRPFLDLLVDRPRLF
jgi:hypothetical protein